MADWNITSTKTLVETPWIKVTEDKLTNHNGKPMVYTYVQIHSPGVSTIATNNEGQVFVQRSYRHTLRKTLWELPSGHSDGQNLLDAAKRELREEAGLTSDHWEDLGCIYLAQGIGNIPHHFFLALDAYLITDERDIDEQISEGQFKDIEEVEALIEQNEPMGFEVPIGLYLAKMKLAKLENQQ